MKKILPFAHAKCVYDINPDFFKKMNVKYIFLDLDNTLATHKTLVPSKETLSYIKKLKENDLIPIIISNNKESRVKTFADKCDVNYIYKTCKPYTFKLNKFLKVNNISKEYVIMIGDQLLTDIKCANRLGVKSVLTEKLWSGDQLITKFTRWLDTIKRNKLKKDNQLIDWEVIYGRIK